MEPPPELGVSDLPAIRKPSKDAAWMGPKESAVRQHRQELKTKMKTNKVEEVKTSRPKQVSRRLLFSRFLSSPGQRKLTHNLTGLLTNTMIELQYFWVTVTVPLKMWNVAGKV